MIFEIRFHIDITEKDPELRADLLERDAAYVDKHFSDVWKVIGTNEELIIVEAGEELDALIRNRPLFPHARVEVRPLRR